MILHLVSSVALAFSLLFLNCRELDKPNRVETGVSTWFTTFGGAKDEVPTIVTPLPDGGWAIVVISRGAWDPEVRVVRLDEQGSVSPLIELAAAHYNIEHIAVTDEGDYIVAEDLFLNATSNDIMVTKISNTGGFLWESVIDHSYREDPGPLLAMSDGGCIVTGEYTIRDSVGSNAGEGMFLTILDKAGHTVLDTTYLHTKNLNLEGIVEVGKDRFVLAGDILQQQDSTQTIVLIALDCFGELFWLKTYGVERYVAVHQVTVSNDGLVVSGQTGSGDSYFFMTDIDGNLLWQRVVPRRACSNARCYRIETSVVTRDSCLVAAGKAFTKGKWQDPDFYFCKLDQSGKLAWAREKGGRGRDEPRFIIEAADGGYLFIGLTKSMGEGGSDVFALKTDRDGNY